MDKDLQKDYRDYAWKYFSLHADQRLKTFHFFVILATFTIGGILAITKDLSNIGYASPLAYLLSFLSFVFWKLDLRNKELVKYGEDALKALEDITNASNPDMKAEILNLFTYEEGKTKNTSRFPRSLLLKEHLSYSDCFNMVFLCFGVGGFVLGCLFTVKAIV